MREIKINVDNFLSSKVSAATGGALQLEVSSSPPPADFVRLPRWDYECAGSDLFRLSDAADFLSLLMAPANLKSHLFRDKGGHFEEEEETRASSREDVDLGDVSHDGGRSRRDSHSGSGIGSSSSDEVGVGARRLLVEAARAVAEGKFNGSFKGAADLVVQRRSHDAVTL